MRPSAIIQQLRGNAYYLDSEGQQVYPFGNNVYGAAEYAELENAEFTDLPVPAAYVVPLQDKTYPQQQRGGNVIRTLVETKFAVVVMGDNTSDRQGLIGVDKMFDYRAAVWRAILNWPKSREDIFSPIEYDSSRLIQQNNARIFWAFVFQTQFIINQDDGAALDCVNLDTIDLKQDMASPSNVGGGPDGQIDAHSRLTNLYPEE